MIGPQRPQVGVASDGDGDGDGTISGGLMSSGALHHDGIRSEQPLFCARLTVSSVFLSNNFFLF